MTQWFYDAIGRNYFRFQIGYGFVSIANSIFSYFTFAKVWQPSFEYYGIPFGFVLAGIPACMTLIAWLLGYYYIKAGLLSAQVSLNNTEGNPEFALMCKRVDLICKKMEIEE